MSRGVCRICLEDGGNVHLPCNCTGHVGTLHSSCFRKWLVFLAQRHLTQCDVCGMHLDIHTLLNRCHVSDVVCVCYGPVFIYLGGVLFIPFLCFISTNAIVVQFVQLWVCSLYFQLLQTL